MGAAIGYDHAAGREQPAQRHLFALPRDPPVETPIGLNVLASGSGQSLPLVPWIALLNPDVTTTAQDGLYLVYLFTAAGEAVYLTLSQGATQHRLAAENTGLRGVAAERAAIEQIGAETAAMRAGLAGAMPSQWVKTAEAIALGADRFLPRAYEAGAVAAVRYDLRSLPDGGELSRDIAAFAQLYTAAIAVKDGLVANRQVSTSARSDRRRVAPPPVVQFKPKDASDYAAHVQAATQRRTRTHEALVEAFGLACITAGHTANTRVHPRDLVITGQGAEWLVEAKTVAPNAEPAVRDAIGQLFAYRHLLYRAHKLPNPRLLALFNSPIGDAFEQLLESLEIEWICRDGPRWAGTDAALALISVEIVA